MTRNEENDLKTFEKLILAAEDFDDPEAGRFRAALAELCEAEDICKVTVEHQAVDMSERVRIQQQMYPPLGVPVCEEELRLIEKQYIYDDLSVVMRLYVQPLFKDENDEDRLKTEAIMRLVALRAHHRYLHEHRFSLHRVDPQTGVYNQDYALSWIGELIENGVVEKYSGCSFNIRGMSVINNRYGMENGTKVLRAYAQTLQEKIGTDGIVARIAGDRFLVFFRNEMLQTVIRYLEGYELTDIEGIRVPLTVSAWAGFDLIRRGETPMGIIDRMNAALRTAKYNSNMTYVFYDEQIEQTVNTNKHIESLFKSALRDGEFKVFYQPKVDLKQYTLAGAEALCRWLHDGRLVMPYQFIPVLENSRDICTLDFYILDRACRDIRRWLDEDRPVVRISVNLSRCHMGDPLLCEKILEIIDRYKVPHRYIEIELTETTTDMGFEDMQKLVRGLTAEGISCSVDDFGVGYSSMNVLREMPWSQIKIDRNFMPSGNGDSEDEKKKTMLKSLITMAHSLGLGCIAEGVETIEQIVLLKTYGCYTAQGFYFDHPMTAEDFEARMTQSL